MSKNEFKMGYGAYLVIGGVVLAIGLFFEWLLYRSWPKDGSWAFFWVVSVFLMALPVVVAIAMVVEFFAQKIRMEQLFEVCLEKELVDHINQNTLKIAPWGNVFYFTDKLIACPVLGKVIDYRDIAWMYRKVVWRRHGSDVWLDLRLASGEEELVPIPDPVILEFMRFCHQHNPGMLVGRENWKEKKEEYKHRVKRREQWGKNPKLDLSEPLPVTLSGRSAAEYLPKTLKTLPKRDAAAYFVVMPKRAGDTAENASLYTHAGDEIYQNTPGQMDRNRLEGFIAQNFLPTQRENAVAFYADATGTEQPEAERAVDRIFAERDERCKLPGKEREHG